MTTNNESGTEKLNALVDAMDLSLTMDQQELAVSTRNVLSMLRQMRSFIDKNHKSRSLDSAFKILQSEFDSLIKDYKQAQSS